MINPAAGLLYPGEQIFLAALVGHPDFFQQSQRLAVNQFHLFRIKWFVNAALQTAAAHFPSLMIMLNL